MKVFQTRVLTHTIVSTDRGDFRVWDHGSIDFYDEYIGMLGDWTCLPEWLSAEEETEIRTAGFNAMGK